MYASTCNFTHNVVRYLTSLCINFVCHHFSACGATLTSLTGVIQSPNFPNDYTNGLACVYVISVPDTYRVTLAFTNFDLENSTGCKYDYVEVLNCWCCCNQGCCYF